jgi:hypothetical protein
MIKNLGNCVSRPSAAAIRFLGYLEQKMEMTE